MKSISQLLYLILPCMLGGITNMIFLKTHFGDLIKKPIDYGLLLADGERLFGENKTWKGFFGMIIFTSIWMGIFALLYRKFQSIRDLSLIKYENFSFPASVWLYGGLWGGAYVMFELPNSFIKRRLKIPPGKNAKGAIGILFTFVDQADSVVGCMFIMLIFYIPSVLEGLLIFFMATGIHYTVNILLFLSGLKKQAG